MITRVQVKNFRSLANVDVSLGRLNVLVGRNGAGKSAFLKVFEFVRDMFRWNLDTSVREHGGYASLVGSEAQGFGNIELDFKMDSSAVHASYNVILRGWRSGTIAVVYESAEVVPLNNAVPARFQAADGELRSLIGAVISDELSQAARGAGPGLVLPLVSLYMPLFGAIMAAFREIDIYDIIPEQLRKPQTPDVPTPLLGRAENLASLIIERIAQAPLWSADIISALKRVVPEIAELRVTAAGRNLVIELEHHHTNGAIWRDLGQESDGTIRALALLAAMYQDAPERFGDTQDGYARLIAIEEPELYIHPGALGVISDAIREASTRRQVVITTQSPDLISHFAADELRIVENVDGETHIGPIDPAQREAINTQLFSGGDLLRIEGLHRATASPVGAGDA